MDKLNAILKYIIHFFSSRHSKGYGVHSPFIFRFTRFVIYEKHPYYVFSEIEKYRSILKRDKRKIKVQNFGTGKSSWMEVGAIARKSLLPEKYGQLLFRIVSYFNCENIIELGTSLGITTTYLSSVSSNINCVTFEGSSEISKLAVQTLRNFKITRTQIVEGDINTTLSKKLDTVERIDFAFLDANHTYDAVLLYFNQLLPYLRENSILVFDDIYWSKDMEKAWEKIKSHEKVTTTIDLFRLGIVFFRTDLHKMHYKMVF